MTNTISIIDTYQREQTSALKCTFRLGEKEGLYTRALYEKSVEIFEKYARKVNENIVDAIKLMQEESAVSEGNAEEMTHITRTLMLIGRQHRVFGQAATEAFVLIDAGEFTQARLLEIYVEEREVLLAREIETLLGKLAQRVDSAESRVERERFRTIVLLIIISIVAILLSLLVAIGLTYAIRKPIVALSKAAVALASEYRDSSDVIDIGGGVDEIGWLTVSFDHMRRVVLEQVDELDREIQRRKEAQRVLSANEENLRITLDSIGDAVIATGLEGDVTRMNPVAETLTGWTVEDARGKSITEVFSIVNAKTRELAFNPVEKVIEQGKNVALANHTLLISKGGDEYHIADSAAPIRNSDGVITGVVLVFRDVTEEYARRKELYELAVIVEQALEGIACADLDGTLRFANPKWCEMHGYENSNELVGKNLSIFHSSEQFNVDTVPFNIKVEKQGHNIGEVGHQRKDGSIFPSQMFVTLLRNEREIPYAYAAFAQDITARKREEVRIEKTNCLKEDLLLIGRLEEKMKRITDALIDLFDADFARIWIASPGDICDAGCVHSKDTEGIHVCQDREHCLHLVASSGRYTHLDGGHRRVPFGSYKIGRVASGDEPGFLTNDVTHDSRVHNHDWAVELGLTSFMGYRLLSRDAKSIGVIALFSKRELSLGDELHFRSIAGTASDVIMAVRREEELIKSEFFLRETQSVARVGGWKINPETDFLACTEGIFQILEAPLNYNPSLQEGLKYYDPECRLHLRDNIELCYTRGRPFVEECKVTTVTGKHLWVEVRGLARVIEEKTPYVYGTLQDITERKQAEDDLCHLRNYLASIIDSMPSVLVGVDFSGIVTQWNSEAQRISGFSTGDAVGQPLSQVFPRLAREMKQVHEAMESREVHSQSRRARMEAGEIHYENVTVYPLTASGVEGAVIRVDDVTEQVRIEEMIVQSEKMLSVGGLAAGMAHEINNPLGGMMQTASVMRDRLTNLELPANKRAAEAAGTSMESISTFMEARKITDMLGRISESGRRAADIVQNMLSFARKGDATFSAHSIAALLDQCVDLAGADYDMKKKYDFRQIEIVREYEEDLPHVICEPSKIQQVLLNILRNGAEAMQEQVKEGRRASEEKSKFVLRLLHEKVKKRVRIELEDNGPGMTEVTRKRIFEPFFTTKPTDRGTGLGLSVSYFIITENHGGEILAESEWGKGAKFIVCLPVNKDSTKECGDAAGETTMNHGE